MIKLIVCDLDGTLLNEYQGISSYSAKIINETINHGIEFMIATGRDYNMVYEYLDKINIQCDCILNNGAQYRSFDGKRNDYYPMDYNKLEQVIKILKKYNYHISMHTTNGKYIFDDLDEYYNRHINMIKSSVDMDLTAYMKEAFFRKDGFLRNTTRIDNLETLIKENVGVLKIDAKVESVEIGKKAMAELEKINHVLLTSSYEAYVEITSDTTHKGGLLEKICEEKGYKNEEVAVFGDSNNDLQMLNLFQNSYAPSNASDLVKREVKEIIGSHKEDGVAKALIKILKECNNINLEG